jgi:hypothetical protein
MKVMKEGIYIGAEYYNPMFCFWVIMFILKSLCTMTTVTMEGFETGRPLYSTIDRYIFSALEGYKLKEYAAIMGGRYW